MNATRLLFAAGFAVAGLSCRPGPEAPPETGTTAITETYLDLLQHPERLEVLEAPRRGAPTVRPLAHAMPWGGGARALSPALVMTPPTRLRFRNDEGRGALFLTGSVALDRKSHKAALEAGYAGTVELQVRRDGQLVVQKRLDVGNERYVGAAIPLRRPGVRVEPGGSLEIEVTWSGPSDAKPAPRIGFPELELRRRKALAIAAATPSSPNIILLVHDTLRADRTSLYGYARKTTPHLEALAERGLTYDVTWSASSWTWPSTASLLTGLPADAHGVRDARACRLAATLESLPEALARAGYDCVGVSGNPLIARAHGFDQGFQEFDDSTALRFTHELWDRIESIVRERVDRRFFLYIHLVDSHSPYHHTESAREQFAGGREIEHALLDICMKNLNAAAARGAKSEGVPDSEQLARLSDNYDAGVATGDHYLGRLALLLENTGLDDRTVLVVTSDHGEELLDHGHIGHGHGLHPELLRVPLVLAGPGVPAGERRTTPVSNRQLAPTLARIGGADLGQLGAPIELGTSKRPPARPLYVSTHGALNADGSRGHNHVVGLRADPWVLVAAADGSRVVGLFRVDEDPEQQTNLAVERPEIVDRLLPRLLELERSQTEAAPRGRPGDQGTLEKLRALGYLGDDE